MDAATRTPEAVRQRIEVRGVVQGVGFRPFVYRLASELALAGWVRNDGGGVTIEAQGDAAAVGRLAQRVRDDAPRLARIDGVAVTDCAPVVGAAGFAIVASSGGARTTAIGPDTAVCDDCLAELFDPGDRRHRYAFINCTNCGPRYTLTHSLPYDRARTSMAAFAQCPACLAEYRAPAHRRFHAEPNACPVCGPRLAMLDAHGKEVAGVDPVAETLARLRAGEIVALKGLGGFHLACDGRNAATVARLRERKAREEKPFALMVANAASLEQWVEASSAECAALVAPERPIVLLKKRAGADATFPGVAPGLAWLGAMLPYTPLHYLLFHDAAGRPAGAAWLDAPQSLVLVMTSANPGGEPLVTGNAEARTRLAGIADAYVVHDRDIVTRCDDSVVRLIRGPGDRARVADVARVEPQAKPGADVDAAASPRVSLALNPGYASNDTSIDATPAFQFIRRARGYTPRAIKLAATGPPIVAVGGHFKNTVCVTRGFDAFLSQHIGELDNAPTCAAQEDAIAHLVAILDVTPALVAHDLHPDYHSTRLAVRLAARWNVPLHGVQHHHAHVAAVVAEHGLRGPVLGLALDGVGLGTDGTAWGGELLRVDGAQCVRLGRCAPLALPGGDRAAREPWRMAAAALARCGRGAEIRRRWADEPAAPTVATMLERRINCPETSSLGRWFDAAAGLLGVTRRMAFEGQAAMLLEGLAERHGPVAADAALYRFTADNELDLTPLVPVLADLRDAGYGAALFHATLAAALAEWVGRAAQRERLGNVAAGGGCLLNAILARELRSALAARGLALFEAQSAPPNDGGLALGQAWVARCATFPECQG